MRKITIPLLFLTLLMIVVAYFTPVFVDSEKIVKELMSSKLDQVKFTFEEGDKPKFELFPIPRLTINSSQLEVGGVQASIGRIEILLEPKAVMMGDFSKVKEIVVSNLHSELAMDSASALNWDDIDSLNVKSITFYNSDLVVKDLGKIDVKNITLAFENNVKKIKITGVLSNEDPIKLDGEFAFANTLSQIDLDLVNKNWDFNINGKLSSELDKALAGIVKLNIKNLNEFSKANFNQVHFANNKPLTITSSFSFGKDQKNIRNLVAKSDGVMDVVAEIEYINLEKKHLKADFVVNNFNLDEIQSLRSFLLNHESASDFSVLNLMKNMDFDIGFDLKKVQILNNFIQDQKIDLKSVDGVLVPVPVAIAMPANVVLNLGLESKKENDENIIIAAVKLDIPNIAEFQEKYKYDLGFKADSKDGIGFDGAFHLGEKVTLLRDFTLKIGKGAVAGEIYFVNNIHPRIFSNITAYNLDYEVTESIVNIVKGVLGSKINDISVVIQDLKKIPYELNAVLTLKKIKFPGLEFKSMDTSLYLDSGKMDLRNVRLETKEDFLKGSILIDSRSFRPKINLNLAGSRANIENLLPSIVASDSGIDWNKILTNLAEKSKNIDSEHVFKFDELVTNGQVLNNFELKISNQREGFTVEKFNFNGFGGQVAATGKGVIMPFGLSASLALSNVDLSKIDSPIKDFISGFVSVSAALTANGNTIDELKTSMNFVGKFHGKSVEIKKINIPSAINLMLDPSINVSNFDNKFQANLINETGSLLFKDISGDLKSNAGVMQLANTAGVSTYTNSSIGGSVDLVSGEVNLLSKFSFLPVKIMEKNTTKFLNFDLKLAGYFLEPKISIDTKEIKSYLNIDK